MARGRRFGRLLAVLVVAAVVFLLLELNRFLPGSWPGGRGDAGARRTDPASARPDRVEPPRTPDPARPPEDGPVLRVRVESADGTPVVRGSLRLVGGEGALALGPEPTALPGSASRGFEVTAEPGGRVSHAAVPRGFGRSITVRLPRAPLPEPPPASARPVLVSGRGGAALPGAHLAVTLPGGEEVSLRTDAQGRAELPAAVGTMRVCASAPGHGDACVHATARGGPLAIRLPENVSVRTEFRDPETGEALRASALRIVREDGTVVPLPVREEGRTSFSEELPADRARSESLEVEVEGRAPLRAALGSLGPTTAVPRGREVRVVATDAQGRPVAGARVETSFAEGAEVEGAPERTVRQERTTDAQGRASAWIPEDRVGRVLVEHDARAPASARVEPGSAGEVRVTLEPGVRLVVRVRDAAAGAPVAGARVVVLARAGSVPARRTAVTGPDGVAELLPVAPGTAEVYAHCDGCAWGAARVEVAAGAAPVEMRLARGLPLRVVVEDPLGVPLAGVRARAVARPDRDSGRPEAVGPDERPWATDDAGVLAVADLPDRELDLYLSKAGYADETLVRVRPGDETWFATLVPAP